MTLVHVVCAPDGSVTERELAQGEKVRSEAASRAVADYRQERAIAQHESAAARIVRALTADPEALAALKRALGVGGKP